MLVEADTVHQYDSSVLIVIIIFLGAFLRSLLIMGTGDAENEQWG